jgi:hypothetical protein
MSHHWERPTADESTRYPQFIAYLVIGSRREPYSAVMLQRRYERGGDVPTWFTPEIPPETPENAQQGVSASYDGTPAPVEVCSVIASLPSNMVGSPCIQSRPESTRNGTTDTDFDLARCAIRAKQTRLFWLWSIARYVDPSGAVYLDELYPRARRFDHNLTRRVFDDALRAGVRAGYWTLTSQARRGQSNYRRRMFYTGYDRLAQRLYSDDTNPPGSLPHAAISLRWNGFEARCYAGWIAASCEQRGISALPISRENLTILTGASVPTLMTWENIADISVQKGKVQVASDAPGFALGDLPEHATIYLTSTGQERYEHRTVNRYHPPKMRFSTSRRTRLTVRRHCIKTFSEHSLSAYCGQPVTTGDGLPGAFERVYFVSDEPQEAAKRADNYTRHSKRAQFNTRRKVYLGQDRQGNARFEWLVAPGLLTELNEQTTPDYARQPANYVRFMQRRVAERQFRSACYA